MSAIKHRRREHKQHVLSVANLWLFLCIDSRRCTHPARGLYTKYASQTQNSKLSLMKVRLRLERSGSQDIVTKGRSEGSHQLVKFLSMQATKYMHKCIVFQQTRFLSSVWPRSAWSVAPNLACDGTNEYFRYVSRIFNMAPLSLFCLFLYISYNKA